MEIEAAVAQIDQILGADGLSDLQEQVFRRVWAKEKYPDIAEALGYDANYIKDVGAKLWKQLSQVLDEKVTKSNIQTVLRRHQLAHPAALSPTTRLDNLPDRPNDWEESFDISGFVGRHRSLETVSEWLHNLPPALISITGIAGIGKSLFAAKLAELHQEQFDGVIWRSLKYPKRLNLLILDLLQGLKAMPQAETSDNHMELLLQRMQQRRCLIILDGFDSILKQDQSDEASYVSFLQYLSTAQHQSTVVITCRDLPQTWATQLSAVRSLQLPPLAAKTVDTLFTRLGTFTGTPADIRTLAEQYGGNPLALQIVASNILDFFDGNITEFLSEGQVVFEGLSAFLQQQWLSLDAEERWILYYLAVRREHVSFREIKSDLLDSVLQRRLSEALLTLARRSLIIKHKSGFGLQAAVLEYVSFNLTSAISQELATSQLGIIRQLPLLKVNAPDYIQAAQKQEVLRPVLELLKSQFLNPHQRNQHLQSLLVPLKTQAADFAAGNLVNLMLQADLPLSTLDLSNLALWDVSFSNYALHRANVQGCDLSRTQFSQAFAGVTCASVAPDGQTFVTGHENGSIYLWNRNGLQLMSLEGHSGWIWDIAWTPDGQRMVSASEDQDLRVWSIDSGDGLQVLAGHGDRIWRVICPNNGTAISCSSDETIRVWDLAKGSCTKTIAGHRGDITALSQVEDDYFLSGGSDRTLRLWNFSSGELVEQWPSETGAIWAIVYCGLSETIYSAGDHGSLLAWKRHQPDPIQSLTHHTRRIWAIDLSPCGKYLVSGGEDQQLVQWDLAQSEVKRLMPGYQGRIWSISHDLSGTQVLTASDDNRIYLWDIHQGHPLLSLSGYSNWACDLTIVSTPEHWTVASAHENGLVYRWDFERASVVAEYAGHSQSAWAIASDPTGQSLVSGSDDRSLRIWDLETGSCTAILRGHQRPVWSVAWSSKGNAIASGSGDRTIKLWHPESGDCLQTLEGHQSRIWSVSFSCDGQMLASGGGDRTVKVWDWETGDCIHTLTEHDSQVLAIAFHPAQQPLLASVGGNGTCKIWTPDFKDCETLTVKTKMLWSVAWSPTGKMLAMGGDDGSIRIWDVEKKTWKTEITSQVGCIWAIAFTPDGTKLCSGSQSGKICVWDTETGKLSDCCQPKRLYEGLNIMDATGLTEAQIQNLKQLGAIA